MFGGWVVCVAMYVSCVHTRIYFCLGRPATSLSPSALMLSSNSLVLEAFHLAPFLPGTAPSPVKPMYKTSLGPWPLSPLRPSLGKHSLAREMDASPVVGSWLVSPQMPYHYGNLLVWIFGFPLQQARVWKHGGYDLRVGCCRRQP